MMVKLTRGIRLVCAACGQTVASWGRRVDGDGLGEYVAAGHDAPGENRPCAGSRQPAPIAEPTAPPPVTKPPAPARAAEQVARWNHDHATGARVAVTLELAEHEATTASLAWVCDGWPSILIDERDHPVRLDTLRPLRPEERLAPVPPPERPPPRRARSRSSRPVQDQADARQQ
jgi:hypothetical protein